MIKISREKNIHLFTIIVELVVLNLEYMEKLDSRFLRQSLGVATANNGVFRKGKLQQPSFSKYTWKMAFVLCRFHSATSRTLCEAKDVGYSCDFSKNSPNPRFWYNTYWTLYHHWSRSIESRGGCRGRPGGHVPPLHPGYTKKLLTLYPFNY